MQDIAATALEADDKILVRPGELIPSDGRLLDASANIDESLLNGESLPVTHCAGDTLAGGTLNVGDAIRLRIAARPGGAILNHILTLVERAQAQKPAIASAADATSGRFLMGVLLLATLTAAAWMMLDPSRAFAATLAVLVVACPCAYAIALPAALSASMAHLARQGVLVSNPNALENLARVDRVVFDKTGTLTFGRLRILDCVTASHVDRNRCLEIAAALEGVSEHAIARAFPPADGTTLAREVRNFWGWLPCGLVYSVLLFAATSGSAANGALAMAAFGLGTLPSMLASSMFALQLRRLPARQSARAASAGMLLVCGTWLIVAAVTPMHHHVH